MYKTQQLCFVSHNKPNYHLRRQIHRKTRPYIFKADGNMKTLLVVVGDWLGLLLFMHRLRLVRSDPPPEANRIKRIPTREGLRVLMAAPMYLLQNPNSR